MQTSRYEFGVSKFRIALFASLLVISASFFELFGYLAWVKIDLGPE
jgi:hypothetical protein